MAVPSARARARSRLAVRLRGGDCLWWLYIAAGAVVMGVYFVFLPEGGSLAERIARVTLYCAVSGSSAAAIAVGLGRHRPARRLP